MYGRLDVNVTGLLDSVAELDRTRCFGPNSSFLLFDIALKKIDDGYFQLGGRDLLRGLMLLTLE